MLNFPVYIMLPPNWLKMDGNNQIKIMTLPDDIRME